MSQASESTDWLKKLCNDTSSASTKTSEELVAAGILLPPYFTHDSFYNTVAIVAATLYCWEYLMTFPAEIRIYFTIPWSAPHLVLFVLMRYTTLIAITMGLYSTWHRQRGNCVEYSEVATLLVQLSVSAVLGWRTIAIWQKDARIIVITFLLLTTLMVFSSLLVLSSKPEKLRNGACIFVEGGNYEFFPLAWFYAGTVVYDTIVIVLSTYRLWQHQKDVDTFAGANTDKTSKGGVSWARWVHTQWNSITPLLFRLTSNGVLYLAFSTIFNVVCFILGHWNEDRAQDLLLLYSSVMWVVCQHLVLLEIRATWGDRPVGQKFGLRDDTTDDTDRLIARILQASGECKGPSWDNEGAIAMAVAVKKSKQTDSRPTLSLSVDTCRDMPSTLCNQASCGGSNLGKESSLPRHLQNPAGPSRKISTLSLHRGLHDDLSGSSVQQLHDFRPPLPGESCDAFGARSITTSERADTTDGNASTSVLIARNEEPLPDPRRTSIRQRLGTLCSAEGPNKLLATLTKSSTRSDALTDTATPSATADFVHPLMDPPPATHPAPRQRDSTCSRLARFSQGFERAPKQTQNPASPALSPTPTQHPYCCSCENGAAILAATARLDETRQSHIRKSASATDRISSLEVADMIATMSDDAKTTALALAGMQGAEPLQSCSPFTSPRTKARQPTWIIHPPL